MRRRASKAFRTKTEEWEAVGLGEEIDRHGTGFYLGEVVLISIAIVSVLFVFDHRADLLPGSILATRIVTMIVLIILGWALARALGRGLAKALFRRMGPGSAGTAGFIIRLLTFAGVTMIALRVAGLQASTLVAGGAFTAVIVGLAAQQTLGNLVAGLVLQSTRALRAGERVRLINGMFAGSIEGTVSQLGLLHASFVNGRERMLVPNREILAAAIMPLREPKRIDMRARFPGTLGPAAIQKLIDDQIGERLMYPSDIVLEGFEDNEVIVRIQATPAESKIGAELAQEIIEIVRLHGTQAMPNPPAPAGSFGAELG